MYLVSTFISWILWTVLIGCTSASYKRVCYHTNWAQYRPEPQKFTPTEIDASLCTHIIYSFGNVSGNTIIPYEWNDESTDWSVGMYEKVANLKYQNPAVKILLAIGGWNHGVKPFSELVDNPTDMIMFAENTIEYLRRINFDGLDLDWEYPANRGSPEVDKQRFTLFCQILRSAFENEELESGNERLLLTAAVAAGEDTVTTAYEIGLIAEELDFINLMSYDLHGSWEDFLGHNSPLYPRQDEIGYQRALNQDYAINLWLNGGTPKEKLIVGMGLYGRSFTMGTAEHELGKPAKDAGTAGLFTREKGFLAYYEVCQNLANGWTRVWNDEQKVPYAYYGNQWVGYDDMESLEIKAVYLCGDGKRGAFSRPLYWFILNNMANYVKSRGLGGSMVWAMDLDDFTNSCGFGVNPLMSKLKEVLSDNTVPTGNPTSIHSTQPPSTQQPTQPTSTAQPTTKQPTQQPSTQQPTQPTSTEQSTTKQPTQQQSTQQPTKQPPTTAQPTQPPTTAQPTQPPTTAQPTQPTSTSQPASTSQPTTQSTICGEPSVCVERFYADPCNNTVYYECSHGIATTRTCSAGLVWDASLNVCNWDYLVQSTTRAPATTRASTITGASTTIGSVDPNSCAPSSCVNAQHYGDSCDQQVYYQCSNGVLYKFKCADGLFWDTSVNTCRRIARRIWK